MFRISTCGVSPFKVWQQKISAILVNDCSFPHVKAYLTTSAVASLAVWQQCWRDRESPSLRAEQILLFPRLVKTKSVAKPKWEAGRNKSSYCPNAYPWCTGVRRVTKRGKKKAAPPLKRGEGGRDQKNPESLSQTHVTGEGDQEEKYNLCLGQREEGKACPRLSGH